MLIRFFFIPLITVKDSDFFFLFFSLLLGLISPVSGSSTEGPCLSSPQDQYLEMLSPLERAQEGLFGSVSERSAYLCMDLTPNQPSGSSGPENSGYLSMAPLNSPGSSLPAWQSHPSSQVNKLLLQGF